jgi:hypothetical protein
MTPARSYEHRPLNSDAVAFGPEAVQFYGSASSYVNGLPTGWSESSDTAGTFVDMFKWARVVYREGACALPGVNIKYSTFIPAMWKAVRLGFVQAQHAEFVHLGLRWGFEVGLHPDRLRGHRFFKNYESSTSEAARARVTEATESRVAVGKTMHLGAVVSDTLTTLKRVFPAAYIFPMGATAKPLEPTKLRPTDDHTRTGLNAACDMTGPPSLSYSLDAYAEMGRRFLPGFAAHVTDVEAAFPMLPFAPWVWPFMFHRFYPGEGDPRSLHLYCHVTGDFGTRGMPGAFKIFLVDVVMNMARAAQTLTLPMTIYVDDLCGTGPLARAVTRRVVKFQGWAEDVVGVTFKVIKDKAASQVQLFVGLWWNSFEGTRTLEERKLVQYMDMLLAFSLRKTLSLRERQTVAGRMQRAVLTMPPGASCLLANIFLLMIGLSVAWQKRRTTRRERQDYKFFYDVLRANYGRGYYTTDRFHEGPTVFSDASRSKKYSGGGWCSSWGPFDYWTYGTAAAKKPIDFLEGDTMICSVETQGPTWAQKLVQYKMDNQSFQRSAVKGWSRAERLNLLLKRLFILQIVGNFLLCFSWVSSEDNEMADHLSREGGLPRFFEAVARRAFVVEPAQLQALPGAGRVRNLDTSVPFNAADVARLSSQARAPPDMLWLSRVLPAVVCLQAATRGWLARRAQERARVLARVTPGSSPEVFGSFFGRWAPAKRCAYGRLEWAYFFPVDEGERLFARVLALSLGLPYFLACAVTGMLLALGTADRLLLHDDVQLQFSTSECVALKQVHSARAIQIWWRWLWARWSRDEPPLPEGAVGWCACTFCSLPIYPGDGAFCDICWPVECGCGCMCQCLCEPVDQTKPRQRLGDALEQLQVEVALAATAPRTRTKRGHHGSRANRRALMLVTMMGVAGAAPRDGYSAQVSTVQYPRASLYEGLPVDFFDTVDELMHNRLTPSSMLKVDIAFERYWKPVAAANGWDEIIATDDPERGGKLATFVLHMLENTALVADSIGTYVWALRWKMKLAHQADPVLGVMHWQDFMRSVRVKSHVPHEPRRAVPLRLILSIIASINVSVHWEVQFAFLLVVMLFTFSRSECPCPKAFTGPNGWDPNKHWMVRDIVIRCVSGVYVLAVRFKSIKQDRRIERPEARGDHRLDVPQGEAARGGSDWSFVGDLPGHALSPFKWYRLLMSFYPGPRAETSPFFLSVDHTRPLTYAGAMSDFKKLLHRVSPDDTDYGLHGLRVEGWNLGAAVDPDLAEAHGGWKPGNASRYSRFQLSSVFNLSRGMVAYPDGGGDGVTAETAIDADARDPPRDLAVDAIFNVDELGNMRWDEPGAEDADDDGVAAWSPGMNVARPNGRHAQGPAAGAGGSNDPLPVQAQPGGPLAVVPQVAEGPHAYVGAALRFMANSPPSRAITRLQATLRQQP